jgi:hypothetical protein
VGTLFDIIGRFVGVDRDVAVFLGVVGVSFVVALINARAALVVLLVLGLLFRVPMAGAAPKVAKGLDAAATTVVGALAQLLPADASATVGLKCGGINPVLATIRKMESGGDYRIRNKYATASGAYQFIDSTWQSLGGSGSAKDAPQDPSAHYKTLHQNYFKQPPPE